jgi:hypothetical protein
MKTTPPAVPRPLPTDDHAGIANVGCLMDVRIIGIIKAKQTEDGETVENDRLLGVAVHPHNHQDLSSIDGVNKSLLS